MPRLLTMKHDYNWLEPYVKILKGKEVLELGCGSGLDTTVISTLAKRLVSSDIAPIQDSQHTVQALDHSKKLPFKSTGFDTVVASLCLHYFSLEVTKEIIAEISRILKPNGKLICRLNSYKDENYGSVGYPQIETGLYNVNGEQKRFFREEDIRILWKQGYSLDNLSHKKIDRYEKAKYVYEFSATRNHV